MPRFPLRFLLPVTFALLLVTGTVLSNTSTQAEQPAATYIHGRLSVSLPFHSERGGSGKLITEILDPENQVLGKAERTLAVSKGDGVWKQVVTPDKPIPLEDLVWQRVHYRFVYIGDHHNAAIEGIESISEILRRPVVHILGQTEYLAGSEAAIRVVVSDAQNSNALETGELKIDLLLPAQKSRRLFSGHLNNRGTVEAQLRFPAELTGKYEMRYALDTPIGSTEYTQPIQLADKAAILLTTEKPIYQPGQAIHVRALALDRAEHKAEADRHLMFEIEDSRGNKVFKSAAVTDKFGVASSEFSLADEVNLGTYHLRALMGDPESPSTTAEIALSVERYVLPKFKVAIQFTQKDNKPKLDYRPGDHVTGTVRANYFFGKPVDHAEIKIQATSMDVTVFEAAATKGKTDNDGVYAFDLRLPEYFAGRPLSQGAARALIEATVTDSAAHAETRGEPITISDASLLLTAVPEGGVLIPHLENEVFVLSSYPDGTPARIDLTVHHSGTRDQQVSTDSGGVAVIRVNPEGTDSLRVDADDHEGNRISTNLPLQTRRGADQVLLRIDGAVFQAGEAMHLKVLSTRAKGSAYVDIVKNGQTILTRDLDLRNGQADLALTTTPEMAGTLDMDAYIFGRNAEPVADHRLVFVQPADELKIETSNDSALYRPGSDARIRFHVTNSHGEGVSAALGVQVVDEAVFALAEKQPGFAKVFFYLEQEVMKPRYEIHSLSMLDVVKPLDVTRNRRQNLEARALFAATEMVVPTKFETEFGRGLPQDRYTEYLQRYTAVFADQIREVVRKVSEHIQERTGEEDILRAFGKTAPGNLRDAWNTPVRIESAGESQGVHFYRVSSAGPDKQFGGADDLNVYVEDRPGGVVSHAGQSGSIQLKIERDRGAVNERTEVTGTVLDASGAFIRGATITLSPHKRIAQSNDAGQFTFAALPAGHYTVEVDSPGFESVTREFTLRMRDRAVLSAVLSVGSTSQSVQVTAANDALVVETGAAPGGVLFQEGQMMKRNAIGDSASVAFVPIAGRALIIDGRPPSDAAPRVRSYFPEALYINPEIITDASGNANISIPIADSITTWRIAMLASTQSGALGTGASSIKVFQDFFVDLDLPVKLTQGDRVSIPIAAYNYSGKPGQVSLKLQSDNWFSLDNETPEKDITVESGRVGASQFTLSAKRIGKFKLTLSARMDGGLGREARQDIVVREIEVIPNGREQALVFNGRLNSSVQQDLQFPRVAVPDASSILVRLYPGPLSQVIEGMDSILSMPGGCFEQTSSGTYPNVLALDYMKRTKKLTPEIHAEAEGYIANGYQRLLTFEVPGGGFSWFGQAPANKILTAYGLMEFSDMSKVSDVDQKLIDRTGNWLASQQQPDGSWKPDASFINEGATNRYNTDVLRITGYIAWALANTGYQGPAVEKAKQFIEAHGNAKADAYTLAVIANFAADFGKDRDFTRQSMEALLDARLTMNTGDKDDIVSWTADETGVYSTGSSAAIETTGLATQALLKWGKASETVRGALHFISSKKQSTGNWGTSQATIMALRALLVASEASASDVRGTVRVMIDGKPVETVKLTQSNNDLLYQFVFKGIEGKKPASVQLAFEGTGGLSYQIVGRYFIPWDEAPADEPLSINVAYDRTTLARNDIATATAIVRNNLRETAKMVMVDLGIPPGFDLLSEDLQSFQEKTAGANAGALEKFSLTATQAILYFNALSPAQTLTLKFRLRAKYPIRARTFQSRVYEYYDPDVKSIARPVRLEVTER